MKSKLKEIYELRNKFDILNKPGYYFASNPFYQVGSFIVEKDEKLLKNFFNNLKDLNIENVSIPGSLVEYDYLTNTLYSGDARADIYGLLHVASNDRNKKYTGVITEVIPGQEIGYGLNNGLTEVFSNDIRYRSFSYPFEATIAKALLMIDEKIVIDSYFNNNGKGLDLINPNIKTLMNLLDNYHDNYIELMSLYKEKFIQRLNKIGNSEQVKLKKEIEDKIYKLEYSNFAIVYNIFNMVVKIINESKMNEEEKQDLFVRLYNEFKFMFNSEEFYYLYELNSEFKKNIYTRKKIK